MHINFGDRISQEKTLLPRWWGESYVNHLIRKRYSRKRRGKEREMVIPYQHTMTIETPTEGEEEDEE